jgi:hypothetical protein
MKSVDTGLHGIISSKTELFTATTTRTSVPFSSKVSSSVFEKELYHVNVDILWGCREYTF